MDLVMHSIPIFFALLDPSVPLLIQGAACPTLGIKISHPIKGLYGFNTLQLPEFLENQHEKEGKVVSPTHWPPSPPR
jgi:hypothetical protein